MRARSTRLAGSVRDRAVASKWDSSSGPIGNAIIRRGAAMVAMHANDDSAYTPHRDYGNPLYRAGIKESMY